MSLREQFEAWWDTERMATAFDSFKHVAEEAFEAGHAASGQTALELLDALRKIEQAFNDSPAHGALACKMAVVATEAIKKARAE